MVIMNTGWIEHTDGDFMFYRDAGTRSIGGVIDAIAAERDAISTKLGFTPVPRAPYCESMKDVKWVNDPCEVAPPNLQHRYVSEDVPYGLVPIAGLGDLLDVPTPAADSMVVLSSIGNETDYWREGLTLEKLGFGGLSAAEILEIANAGY
jgi:opine dehydrogenase